MTTSARFDVAALSRAIEERDTDAALAQYAEDAEVSIVDASTPPSRPRVLAGRKAIKDWVADVNARDMTHRIAWTVQHDGKAAIAENCQYPDGAKVLCVALLDITDGRSTRQLVTQSWDA